jgi:M6 family metalloprotease-like protein
MPMAFIDKEFTFTQPDGTQLRVRGTGNQTRATFATLDGHPLVRNPASGFYEYARIGAGSDTLVATGVRPGVGTPPAETLAVIARTARAGGTPTIASALSRARRPPPRWEIRREERRTAARIAAAAPAPPSHITVGRFVGLCLLVDFPDVDAATPRISSAEVAAFCNSKGYRGFGNSGSVRDYFFDNSDGKLTYTNVVAPWYMAKQPRSYYADETGQTDNTDNAVRARELVEEALAHHVAQGFNFSGLTADATQHLLALNVLYVGRVVNEWNRGLWPHSGSLDAPYALAPKVFAYDYQITNMGDELTLGTFCHENGHMVCEFPDLYAAKEEWWGTGYYCLMGYGGSPDPKNPAQICAYLKHAAGWSSATTVVKPKSNFRLRAGRNEFAMHRKSPTEYFIIENRARTGRDANLTDAGLAIWHVDEEGSNYEVLKSRSKQHECALIQADGHDDLERKKNPGDSTDLFKAGSFDHVSDTPQSPTTRWLDGTLSALDVRNISAAGPVMTFSTGPGPHPAPGDPDV